MLPAFLCCGSPSHPENYFSTSCQKTWQLNYWSMNLSANPAPDVSPHFHSRHSHLTVTHLLSFPPHRPCMETGLSRKSSPSWTWTYLLAVYVQGRSHIWGRCTMLLIRCLMVLCLGVSRWHCVRNSVRKACYTLSSSRAALGRSQPWACWKYCSSSYRSTPWQERGRWISRSLPSPSSSWGSECRGGEEKKRCPPSQSTDVESLFLGVLFGSHNYCGICHV